MEQKVLVNCLYLKLLGLKVVEVKNLTVKFGNFYAVKNISFTVEKGEIFGFLGANGAGKTTTIKMLCGLLTPTSGICTIAEFNLNKDVSNIKKSIGYMSQRFSLYGNLTVSENIETYSRYFF